MTKEMLITKIMDMATSKERTILNTEFIGEIVPSIVEATNIEIVEGDYQKIILKKENEEIGVFIVKDASIRFDKKELAPKSMNLSSFTITKTNDIVGVQNREIINFTKYITEKIDLDEFSIIDGRMPYGLNVLYETLECVNNEASNKETNEISLVVYEKDQKDKVGDINFKNELFNTIMQTYLINESDIIYYSGDHRVVQYVSTRANRCNIYKETESYDISANNKYSYDDTAYIINDKPIKTK